MNNLMKFIYQALVLLCGQEEIKNLDKNVEKFKREVKVKYLWNIVNFQTISGRKRSVFWTSKYLAILKYGCKNILRKISLFLVWFHGLLFELERGRSPSKLFQNDNGYESSINQQLQKITWLKLTCANCFYWQCLS